MLCGYNKRLTGRTLLATTHLELTLMMCSLISSRVLFSCNDHEPIVGLQKQKQKPENKQRSY